jgi:hypothetical protein
MLFEPLDTPFADVERLGCRDLLWGQKLILDLFEYLATGPAEEMEVAGEKVSDVHTIALTASSRIWRLTFESPLAVRVRDESIRHLEPRDNPQPQLPSRYCFTYKSPWLSELLPHATDPRLGELTPAHYVFDLLDDFIEIETIENDLA